MDILQGPSMPESKRDIIDDPMDTMDPLDLSPTRKRPLWLHDTLQDAKRHILARRSLIESKKIL